MDKLETIIFRDFSPKSLVKFELNGYIVSQKTTVLWSSYVLNLDATNFWLKIIKDNNFEGSFFFKCQTVPMLQCLGFPVLLGNYLGAISQYDIFDKYKLTERTKMNYISLQTELIEAGLFEVAVFDNTYINEIDKIFENLNHE